MLLLHIVACSCFRLFMREEEGYLLTMTIYRLV